MYMLKSGNIIQRLFAVIFTGLMVSGCAAGPKKASWTAMDHVLFSTALALHGSDWMQTKNGVIEKGMVEGNVFLGDHPDEKSIDMYFASTAMAMSVLSVTASKGQRRVLLLAWNFFGIINVMHNNSMGVEISIKR